MGDFKRKIRNKPDMENISDVVVEKKEVDDKVFKVTVVSDFRKLKAGEVFDFALPITIIVGENGSGKSSLLHSIRGKYEKKSGSLFSEDYVKLSKNIQVETGVKKFIFYDSIKDDGANMNNAYDASSFISNGGHHTQRLSHGETQFYYISKILTDIEKIRKTSSEKIILVLDEFDKGFSLTNQSKVINILSNISNRHNCQIICVSHNYLLIEKIGVVYDIEKREYVLSKDYLANFSI